MKWIIPIYNRYGQLVMRLTVRNTHRRVDAERKAEDYVEAKYLDCWISYNEIEQAFDEVQVQEIEI